MDSLLDLLLNFIAFGGTGSQPKTVEDAKIQLACTAMIFASVLIVGILVFGLIQWRIAHFPHAVATITSVWEERLAKGGNQIVVGTITFTRSHNGKSFNCEVTKELGEPSNGFAVGDKFDIIPATGSVSESISSDVFRTDAPLSRSERPP